MAFIPRHLVSRAVKALETFPVVYINGPRQAGKTTFVRHVNGGGTPREFITFDDPLERSAATRNPLTYLREAGYPLILDEIQMVPEIFRPLKLLVDEQRLSAITNDERVGGRYLLTGSANLLLLPALADAMVGRMVTLTLLPFSAAEVVGHESTFIERCFERDFSDLKSGEIPLLEAMENATFPELRQTDAAFKSSWFQNYVRKVTLEDPKAIYNLEKAAYMPALLQALATRAGNLLNDADISRELGITAMTVRTYRTLLNGSFITQDLAPWYRNLNKRLTKAHKIYFCDTALLAHLLLSTPRALAHENLTRFGHCLENFVLSELQKANNCLLRPVEISFYRTNEGREVDFVLERGGKIVGIEVKNSEKITDKDLSGLKELQALTGDDFIVGIVLCNTARVIPYDEGIYLVPFSALWS